MPLTLPPNYSGLSIGLPPLSHTLGFVKRLPTSLQESLTVSALVKYYDENHLSWESERKEGQVVKGKRKRSYASTTLEERAVLDCYPYKPCVIDEKVIGALLRWQVRRVQVWFHNNRTKKTGAPKKYVQPEPVAKPRKGKGKKSVVKKEDPDPGFVFNPPSRNQSKPQPETETIVKAEEVESLPFSSFAPPPSPLPTTTTATTSSAQETLNQDDSSSTYSSSTSLLSDFANSTQITTSSVRSKSSSPSTPSVPTSSSKQPVQTASTSSLPLSVPSPSSSPKQSKVRSDQTLTITSPNRKRQKLDFSIDPSSSVSSSSLTDWSWDQFNNSDDALASLGLFDFVNSICGLDQGSEGYFS